jgi:hypothetical protein
MNDKFAKVHGDIQENFSPEAVCEWADTVDQKLSALTQGCSELANVLKSINHNAETLAIQYCEMTNLELLSRIVELESRLNDK